MSSALQISSYTQKGLENRAWFLKMGIRQRAGEFCDLDKPFKTHPCSCLSSILRELKVNVLDHIGIMVPQKG